MTLESALATVLGAEPDFDRAASTRLGVDLVVCFDDHVFVVEAKHDARVATVASAAEQSKHMADKLPGAIPLVAVPLMGDAGAAEAARAGVGWFDRAGNGSLVARGLRIAIRGRRATELGEKRGGEVNPFSWRASRIPHLLLMTKPPRAWDQLELVTKSKLDKGFVSKIVRALGEQGLVREMRVGRRRQVEVVDPRLLLDAWDERYARPRIHAFGLLAGRDGFESLSRITAILGEEGYLSTFTGLCAAAEYVRFGAFRRVSVYVDRELSEAAAARLGISPDARGRNVAISVSDDGVRIGAQRVEDTIYVSPVLAYLDLKTEPERAAEARIEMRRRLLEEWM